jgi:hypothetical protein
LITLDEVYTYTITPGTDAKDNLVIFCSLKPSFEKIETTLVKAGLKWFLDETISVFDGGNQEFILPFVQASQVYSQSYLDSWI